MDGLAGREARRQSEARRRGPATGLAGRGQKMLAEGASRNEVAMRLGIPKSIVYRELS
jgi:hypothetical protein